MIIKIVAGTYTNFCMILYFANIAPTCRPANKNAPLMIAMNIVVMSAVYPNIAAPNPAPKASIDKAIPKISASDIEIAPDRSVSALDGVDRTDDNLEVSRDFSVSTSGSSSVDNSFLERKLFQIEKSPIHIKMIPPILLVNSGEMVERNAVPIVIAKKTTVPEQHIIMNIAGNGTLIFRSPYVIPTTKPSILSAVTKKKKTQYYNIVLPLKIFCVCFL